MSWKESGPEGATTYRGYRAPDGAAYMATCVALGDERRVRWLLLRMPPTEENLRNGVGGSSHTMLSAQASCEEVAKALSLHTVEAIIEAPKSAAELEAERAERARRQQLAYDEVMALPGPFATRRRT